MGKVTYMYPVADVCGKIDKSSRVIFAHRGDKKYTMLQGVRSTAPTPAELAQRTKFKTAVTKTRERLQNAEQYAADQLAFSKQTKYKTLYQYVFNDEFSKLL